jgi:hypothetical protein
MVDKSKTCGACQNMEAYWAEKARQKAAAQGGLNEEIERLAHAPAADATEGDAEGGESASTSD